MPEDSVELLRVAIQAAWKDAQYPGDRYVDAGWENEDAVRRGLMGKHWRDVDPEFAKPFAYDDNLQFLKPEALAFFLPAFLLIDLEDGSMPFVATLAPKPKEHRNWWNLDAFWARVDALTEEQKHVVARYFTYWHAKNWFLESEWALVVEYWEPYLNPPPKPA